MRAFAALPPVRSDVLILQPVTEARAPLWETTDDYNVVWVGEKVGRIYRHPDCFEARQFGTPWYWGFGHPAFRVGASGHVATKEAALAAFRAAWDQLKSGRFPEQVGKHCPSSEGTGPCRESRSPPNSCAPI